MHLGCLRNERIDKGEPSSKLTQDGLQSIRALAERWVKIDQSLCTQAPYVEFLSAAQRLSSAGQDVYVHENCRITFRNRITRKEAQSKKLLPSSSGTTGSHKSNEDVASPPYRIRRGSLPTKKICFICNVQTADDSKPFNSGGLGQCSEKNAVSKILQARDVKINDETDKLHAAAKRIDVILSGASYDVFAADVYYHKTCYDKFTYTYERKLPAEEDGLVSEVMDGFFKLLQCMVIKDLNAYFLTELIDDIKEMSEEYDVRDPPISKTYTLKKCLTDLEMPLTFTCWETSRSSTLVRSIHFSTLRLHYKEMDFVNLI